MKCWRVLLVAVLICQSSALTIRARVVQEQKTSGQNSVKSEAAKEPDGAEELDPLRQNALTVIEREIDRAKKYNQASASVVVWSGAADAIWDYNTVRAKKLLRAAFAFTDRAAASPRQGESEMLRNARTDALQKRLQGEVLAVAQRHEPAFVKELTGFIKEDKEELVALHNQPQVFGTSSLQKRSLAQLAARLAATDAKFSVDLAVESLGYGVPQEFNEIFRTLIARDAAAAHQLFERAVSDFTGDPSDNLYDAMILTGYLSLLPKPETDVALVRRFLDAAIARVKKVREQSSSEGKSDEGLNSAIFLSLNRLHIFYRLYWPEKAGEVFSMSRQLAPELKPGELASEEIFPTEASRQDVDSILARAEVEKNSDNRDALFFQAAISLSKKGEPQRALDIVARARTGDRREAIITYIRRAHAQQLIAAGELYDAIKVIGKIESPEERADVTILLVKAARKKNDLVLARSVLSDTQKLLNSQPGSTTHARAYLWLASSYSTIDPVIGFEMMASAVKAANTARELEDIRSEPKLMQLGGSSRQAVQVGDSKGDFRQGFQQLARSDFVRAISVAESFESELLRGAAIITAATFVFKEKPKKATD